MAFSRDGPEGEKRIYVQDLIREDAEDVWKIIGQRKGWILISGFVCYNCLPLAMKTDTLCRSSNKMPAAVKEAISYAVEKHGGRSAEDAKTYVDDMIKEGRLIEECWS